MQAPWLALARRACRASPSAGPLADAPTPRRAKTDSGTRQHCKLLGWCSQYFSLARAVRQCQACCTSIRQLPTVEFQSHVAVGCRLGANTRTAPCPPVDFISCSRSLLLDSDSNSQARPDTPNSCVRAGAGRTRSHQRGRRHSAVRTWNRTLCATSPDGWPGAQQACSAQG